MNIDYILNGSKSKKKQVKDPLMDLFSMKSKKQNNLIKLFKGQGNPFVGDRVTKSQRRVLKSRKNLFDDWDRDGVINGLDCQPRNRRRHMPKLYTWQHPEDEQNPHHAADSELRNQTYGRSTGMTGTGLYAYKSKYQAQKEAEGSSVYNGRKLYSVQTDRPKVFDDHTKFRNYNKASSLHNAATRSNDPEILKDSLMYYKKAGIRTNMKELQDSINQARNQIEQPVNYLMRKKGYDAVVADDSNDQYRYGSVLLGKTGEFKGKLKEPEAEDYNWNRHKDNVEKKPVGNHYNDTYRALIYKEKDSEKAEQLAYSDRYENPVKRQKLYNRIRGKLQNRAQQNQKLAEEYLFDKDDEEMYEMLSRSASQDKYDAEKISPNPRKFQKIAQENPPLQEVRDTIDED